MAEKSRFTNVLNIKYIHVPFYVKPTLISCNGMTEKWGCQVKNFIICWFLFILYFLKFYLKQLKHLY